MTKIWYNSFTLKSELLPMSFFVSLPHGWKEVDNYIVKKVKTNHITIESYFNRFIVSVLDSKFVPLEPKVTCHTLMEAWKVVEKLEEIYN